MEFNSECRSCQRLYHYRKRLQQQFPHYHNAPVPASGDLNSHLFIVGLAPGLHGANASGLPFTGDQAGDFLFKTLHQFGFSDQSTASKLRGCQITNAVKCLPPENRPLGREINLCNRYLKTELNHLEDNSVIIALGGIAHNAVIKAFGLSQSCYKFAHQAEHQLENNITLIDSYHCSRYNVQTRRLTAAMFNSVFERAKSLLAGVQS